MPFDAEEAELLSATQSLCRWSADSDVSSSASVSALPSTVDSLRVIELFLRRDQPTLQPHHRSVGRWQTVQTALLPLMTTYKRDREVVYPVMKLLVRLTMALPSDSSESDSRRERTTHQRQIRSAMLDGAHLDVLMQWLTPLLARPPAVRSVDDVNLIELSLTLIKNLLAISAGSNTQPNAAADETASSSKADAAQSSHGRPVGERIIRRYAECGVLDMLAAVCWQPEDLDKFGLLLLEMVAHIVGGVGVDELLAELRRIEREQEAKRQKEQSAAAATQAARSSAAGQYSYLWRGQSQSSNKSASVAPPSLSSADSSSSSSLGWQLQTVRLNEKSRFVAPSRHSRFGTLLTLPSPLSASLMESGDLSAPPLSSGSQLVRNMFDMHAMGSDNLPAFRGRTPRLANNSAAAVSSVAGERGVCAELVQFVVQFISDGCYERLMDSAVKELRANVRVVRDDERNWMTVAALMMGVWREQQMNDVRQHNQQRDDDNNNNNKENIPQPDTTDGSHKSSPSSSLPATPYFHCEPVMACLSSTAFSLLTSKLLLYIQEKPSPLPFLTASLQLYSEIVHTLSCMIRTASPDDRERANQLRHAFYYEKEQLDLLVSLMRQWNAHSWGGQLMALLVECVHWSMQMLDDVDGELTISQRKKKRVVKNKTVLVDGAKQKMAIAELQQALPANVILDANTRAQLQQQQDGQQTDEQTPQQQDVPVMAVAVAEQVQPASMTTLAETVEEPTRHQAQQEARAEPAEGDNCEQSKQDHQPPQYNEVQADAVTGEVESAQLLSKQSAAPSSFDSQAATLPPPTDSIDSTAETVRLPDTGDHGAANTAETTDSVDSNAATQEAMSLGQQEALMTFDSRAQTLVLPDDAIHDNAMELVATQPLPADELLQVNNESECDVHGHTAHAAERMSAPPDTHSSVIDVSDASLSTLVSEMAIQPLDVVMDSIAPNDTATLTDGGEQMGEQQSVDQLDVESRLPAPPDGSDNETSEEPLRDGGDTTNVAGSSPSLVEAPLVSTTEQRAHVSLDGEAATDDNKAAVVPVVAAVAVEVLPVIATSVSMAAGAVPAATPGSAVEVVDSEEMEVSEDEDGYFRMEATFNFSAYLLSYANPTILSHYLTLLAAYRTNSVSLNAHLVHFLSRIAFDRQLMPMLFQLSFLQLCDTILNDQLLKQEKDKPDSRWRELTSFCKKIVRGFFDWLDKEERGQMMFVECLFWKTVNAVEVMRGGYRGGDGDDREDDEDGGERQDEEAWQAEVQAQVDGDWQPGQLSDNSNSAVTKVKSARRKKAATSPLDEAEADDRDSGEEIDLTLLMNQQAQKEKQRVRREKKEQRRKEMEAKEKERDRQRRALMAMEEDDEEELQLGEYNEQEVEERRRREQRGRDEAAEAEGAEKEWQQEEEELLRMEYPLFAALKSRYALMSSRLHSRFTQEEVRRKIKQLGLDKEQTETAPATDTPASPTRQQLRVDTDLHTATTDEEQSEVDTSEMAIEHNSPRASSTPKATPAPLIPVSEIAPSVVTPTPRGARAPSGSAVDVNSITGTLYDLVSDMTRHEHHRTFLRLVVHTLSACAQQRQQYNADWKQFAVATLSPSVGDDRATTVGERRLKRQRHLLSSLRLMRRAGGVWSVQRQYTADRLEAVVATIERAYGNTMDDITADGAQQAKEEEEHVEEELDAVQQRQPEENEHEEEANEEADEAASATDVASSREGEVALLPVSTPRETRKRSAAQLSQLMGSGGGSEQATSIVHAEDEMDDAELADFLRQRRNRLINHTAARSIAAQQPHSQQSASHSDDGAEPLIVAGRVRTGRLRKVAAADRENEEEEEGGGHEEAQQQSATVVSLSTPVTDRELVTKRRRVILDDEEETEMNVT